jgi:hypothetical protein
MCNVINQVLSLYNIKNKVSDETYYYRNGDIKYIKTFYNNSILYKIEIYDINGFNNSKYYGMLVLQPIHKLIHTKKDSIRFLFETLR